MLAYPKIGPQYAIKRNGRAIERQFILFILFLNPDYLGRKKTCSMICGAIVDKNVTLHSQVYSRAIKQHV